MNTGAWIVFGICVVAVVTVWKLSTTDWLDVEASKEPWPPRRSPPSPMPADLQEIRDHAIGSAAADHYAGRESANPNPKHSQQFATWAIAYTETRELLRLNPLITQRTL